MTGRVSKQSVDELKPGDLLWDDRLIGFGVRRQRTGVRSYFVKYGSGRRGRARWLTLGRHGGPWIDEKGRACTLTAELARREALRLLGEKARGNDPAARRMRERSLPTFEEFSKRYLEDYARPHKKPRSAREDELNFKQRIIPTLGRQRIDRITHADVVRFHLSLKQTPILANRCLALISHVFTTGGRWGLIEGNPCRGVPRFKERKRERFLSPAELGRLAQALQEAELGHPLAVAAIRLLLLTGARLGEILGLRWEHVNPEGRMISLPDSKTGKKVIRLNAPALQVLATVPRLGRSPFVFWSSQDGKHLSRPTEVWTAISTKAGLEGLRLHDLRHSFASVAVSGGASLPLIAGLLGHASTETTKRYAHLGDDPLRELAERTGEQIAAAMRATK